MAEQVSNGGEDRASTRDLILDAAERVVARDGARRLTIDAVVKESGYSKGGILYNFPSKLALIKGMVERVVDSHAERHQAAISEAEAEGRSPLEAMARVLMRKKERDLDRQVSMGATRSPKFAPISLIMRRTLSWRPSCFWPQTACISLTS